MASTIFAPGGEPCASFKVEADEQGVTVAVNDTGLGVPPAEQALIFDEFRQSALTAARGYGGLGLGLAICKRLVELHGGEIGVRSSGEEGAGAAFYFRLPAMEGAPRRHRRRGGGKRSGCCAKRPSKANASGRT